MRNKKTIIMSVLIAVISVMALVYSSIKPRDIDQIPPDESSEIDYSDQAYIVEGAGLFSLMESPESYDNLGKDMYVFAKVGYEKYKSVSDTVIGFEITTGPEKNNNEVTLEGRFGASRNTVKIKATLLKYDRVKTSITDTVTGLNIDDELPSNTKRNQFIGSLPIETTDYTISYIEGDDLFLVNVFNTSTNFDKAEKVILESLGIKSLDEDNIIKYGAGDRNQEAGF